MKVPNMKKTRTVCENKYKKNKNKNTTKIFFSTEVKKQNRREDKLMKSNFNS